MGPRTIECTQQSVPVSTINFPFSLLKSVSWRLKVPLHCLLTSLDSLFSAEYHLGGVPDYLFPMSPYSLTIVCFLSCSFAFSVVGVTDSNSEKWRVNDLFLHDAGKQSQD